MSSSSLEVLLQRGFQTFRSIGQNDLVYKDLRRENTECNRWFWSSGSAFSGEREVGRLVGLNLGRYAFLFEESNKRLANPIFGLRRSCKLVAKRRNTPFDQRAELYVAPPDEIAKSIGELLRISRRWRARLGRTNSREKERQSRHCNADKLATTLRHDGHGALYLVTMVSQRAKSMSGDQTTPQIVRHPFTIRLF
jgi:hypothetical protein